MVNLVIRNTKQRNGEIVDRSGLTRITTVYEANESL